MPQSLIESLLCLNTFCSASAGRPVLRVWGRSRRHGNSVDRPLACRKPLQCGTGCCNDRFASLQARPSTGEHGGDFATGAACFLCKSCTGLCQSCPANTTQVLGFHQGPAVQQVDRRHWKQPHCASLCVICSGHTPSGHSRVPQKESGPSVQAWSALQRPAGAAPPS